MTPGAAAHICGVVPKGPVRTYNRSVDVMEQIMPGDYLVSVNGETRNGQPILDAIDAAESCVHVEVWRPHLWTVAVRRLSEYELRARSHAQGGGSVRSHPQDGGSARSARLFFFSASSDI